MQVTSFNPIYGSNNIKEALNFFEKLGFNQIHDFSSEGFELKTLENSQGLRVDIINNDYIRENNINGYFAVRINVDDINEALDFFKENEAEQIMPLFQEGDSRILTALKTANNDIYYLIQHIK